MCEVLEVSQSGYYDWRKRQREGSHRASDRQKLLRAIEDIFIGSHRRYGSPKVFQALKALGYKVSKSTVERLMRENGFYSKARRKFKTTTDSNHKLPVCPNLLMQGFTAFGPNQIWVSDITYIDTG